MILEPKQKNFEGQYKVKEQVKFLFYFRHMLTVYAKKSDPS
jgi:hypothetical protein